MLSTGRVQYNNRLVDTFFPGSLEDRRRVWLAERSRGALDAHSALLAQSKKHLDAQERHLDRQAVTEQWMEHLMQQLENREINEETDPLSKEVKAATTLVERKKRTKARDRRTR